jgi:hypothetical protein
VTTGKGKIKKKRLVTHPGENPGSRFKFSEPRNSIVHSSKVVYNSSIGSNKVYIYFIRSEKSIV